MGELKKVDICVLKDIQDRREEDFEVNRLMRRKLKRQKAHLKKNSHKYLGVALCNPGSISIPRVRH